MGREYDAARAKVIGKRLEETRKARGYSRRKVAELAGISAPYLYRLERGKRMAPIVTLDRLAQALDIDTNSLLLGLDRKEAEANAQGPRAVRPPSDTSCQQNEKNEKREMHLWLSVVADAIKQNLRPEDLKDAIALLQAMRSILHKSQ